MIDQKELPGYVDQQLPELGGICHEAHCRNAYDIAGQMIGYINNQVLKSNINAARQCLTLADNLYKKGNSGIKNAIENVFVYSFTHMFFHEEARKKMMLEILPPSLYEVYKKQVIYSHL